MPFLNRTDTYWDKRAEEQLTFVELQSLPNLKAIDKVYLNARRYTLEQVKNLYLAYYLKNGWDTQALRSIAPQGDIRRFREAVATAGLIDELPVNYSARLTRLEMVEANLWLEANKAALAHGAIQTAAHTEAVATAYQYAMYNLSKGTGVVPAFSQLNTRTIDNILKTKFYGKNYSDRIWANKGKLVKNLREELASAVASGQSYSKTANNIRESYGVTRYEANRLIRTETNHFNTLGSVESYQSAGLEEFIFVATLDARTSTICQEHDGKKYTMKNLDVQPPLHPNCRSTIRAFLGKEYEPDQRIMRDPETGKNRYISNMSYDQWRELYL